MASRHLTFDISMTEVAHFRRLVMFLEGCERLAEDRDDDELRQMVEDARDDLARFSERA